MPIVGMPTFSEEPLTTAVMNAWMTAIEDKFDGGILPEDFKWPFTLNGDINLNGNTLLGVAKFWNARNVATRSGSQTAQALFDAVSGEGGGVVRIPGNTTQPAGGVRNPGGSFLVSGLEARPNISFVGDGVSSKIESGLKLNSDSRMNLLWVDVLRANVAERIQIENCWIDTNAAVGLGEFTSCKEVLFRNCRITAPIEFSGCTSVKFINCLFSYEFTDTQLTFTDCNLVEFQTCIFNGSGASTSPFVAVSLTGCNDVHFKSCILAGENDGVYATRCKRLRFSYCVLSNTTQGNLWVIESAEDVSLRGSVFVSGKTCVHIGSTKGIEDLTGNAVSKTLRLRVEGCVLSNAEGDAGGALIYALQDGQFDINAGRISIIGNSIEADDFAFVILNAVADPTNKVVDMQFIGNISESYTESGFAVSTDFDSMARGGDIGTFVYNNGFIGDHRSMGAWFILTSNQIIGFLAGPGTGNDASDDSGGRSIVQNNITA